jgi:uncharacterized cupredoxin-like copper-binding protein
MDATLRRPRPCTSDAALCGAALAKVKPRSAASRGAVTRRIDHRLRAVRRSTWLLAALLVAGCGAGAPPATPPVVPGSSASPRELNVVLKDWIFLPDPVDVVPGETVLLHVVNGGLEIHELVIGDQAVQDAWEAAELATVGAPPGPTPAISVPPDVAGIRVVVPSGQRVDVTWHVPASATEVNRLLLGCHIPGHWEKGMRARFEVAGAAASAATSQ